MKRTFFISAFILLYFSTLNVYGYDEQRAIVNLANDYAECAAYYVIAAEGLRKTGDDKLADKTMDISKKATEYAIQLSNQRVTEARVELAFDKQRKMIDNDYSNFSILILKYADMCKEVMENPDKRLQYWLNKKD